MGQEASFLRTYFLAWFHFCELAKGMRKIVVKSPSAQHQFDWGFFDHTLDNTVWWPVTPRHSAATQFQAENIKQ